MDLTLKHASLIDCFFISNRKCESIADEYFWFRRMYNAGANYILLNNCRVFGPFPKPIEPWDISELQKIATYNPEVTKVLTWINTKIIINLGVMDYKTLDVLVRIATGMLNKCNIPRSVQMFFHDNMVKNLWSEYTNIVTADLPF